MASAEFFSSPGLGRGAPGRGAGLAPPGRGAGFGPPGREASAGPGLGPGLPPGLGIPCDGAKGLLPGRAPPRGFGPGLPPGLGIPCAGAKGLLPGRAPPRGLGAAAPGFGAGLPAAGRSEPGLGAAGPGCAAAAGPGRAAEVRAAGSGASGVALRVDSGAAGRGFGSLFGAGLAAVPGLGAGFDGAGDASCAAGAAGFAPGLGAVREPERAAPAGEAFLGAGFGLVSLLPPPSAYASFSLRTTGASTVEEAERTNSPMFCSFSSTSLLVVPSSLASSWTRGFATFLLSGLHPGQGGTSLRGEQSSSHCSRPSVGSLISEHSLLGFHSVYPLFSEWWIRHGESGGSAGAPRNALANAFFLYAADQHSSAG